MEQTSIYSLIVGKFFNSKKKTLKWKQFQYLSVDNMKKTGFYGYFYDFNVDYDAIAIDDISDIQKY